MIGGSRELDESCFESRGERGRAGAANGECRSGRRWECTGGMAANAHRAMNRSPLVVLSSVVSEGSNVSAVDADSLTGGRRGGGQRGKEKARENDIQNKRIGGNPCRSDADDPFARCAFHSRSPRLNINGAAASQSCSSRSGGGQSSRPAMPVRSSYAPGRGNATAITKTRCRRAGRAS